MIAPLEVFNWLNREQNSHLSNRSRFSIWQINDPKLPDSQKDGMIDALVNATRTGPDEFEHLEVLVFAGKTQMDRRHYVEAIRHLETSAARYTALNDPFRAGVVNWMLSMVNWEMGDNNPGLAHARAARDAFEKIVNERRQELLDKSRRLPGIEERVRWFANQIEKMDDTLAEKPEEGFTWLNRFEESYLSPPAKSLRESVFTQMTQRDFYRANALMSELHETIRTSLEPSERAEAYAFSGLIFHQMGNARDAERAFRSAMSLFPQERHHHTVTKWMLALVLDRTPHRRSESVRLANECVRNFEGLRLDSDHRNRTKERMWYETQTEILTRVTRRLTGQL